MILERSLQSENFIGHWALVLSEVEVLVIGKRQRGRGENKKLALSPLLLIFLN
ncbi:hypothetical protein GXM_03559 [Nostoc sphaeroides CCNUC1]|uniref:Uncharacterized protein n=1 Tax=Nostoc sphaeroides CCNUC1 TaxID=2653204 RepID=A0A5P8W242_9NOSO|nr:hypothetical protein GXM_03559 [Nostoc sphaeroides CCNUC1]